MKTFKTNQRHPKHGAKYNGHYRVPRANVGRKHPDYGMHPSQHALNKAARAEAPVRAR